MGFSQWLWHDVTTLLGTAAHKGMYNVYSLLRMKTDKRFLLILFSQPGVFLQKVTLILCRTSGSTDF